MRGFKIVVNGGIMPSRGTKKSAGYDFFARAKQVIPAWRTGLIKTGVTAYMEDDEWLLLKARSGLALKKQLLVGAGVIDADYYPEEIGIVLHNHSDKDFVVTAGDKISQGIFVKYLLSDDDAATDNREGGFGSTGR